MPLGTFLHFVSSHIFRLTRIISQFINGVQPLWEDPNCADGGRWTIRTPKTHTAKFWEDLLLAMVGEQFDTVPKGEVLGLVISTKFTGDTISLWHRSATNADIVAALKAKMESLLEIDQETMHLEHENFKEAMNAPKKERTFQPQNRGGDDWQRGGGRGRGRGGRGRGRGNFGARVDDDGFQQV